MTVMKLIMILVVMATVATVVQTHFILTSSRGLSWIIAYCLTISQLDLYLCCF